MSLTTPELGYTKSQPELTLAELSMTVSVREIYGVQKVYPADQTSRLFAQLAGTITLTDDAIATIKALGYTINVQQTTL